MQNIVNKSLDELQSYFAENGLPAYRAGQVYSWLHRKLTFNFDGMTDLGQELREWLKEKYYIKTLALKHSVTAADGTKKYLFELLDGHRIESVLLSDDTGRKTVCVSTQAGCPLGCAFCATGRDGLQRDLETSEILGQVYAIAEETQDISNVVFMGMGEPFLNYANLLKAIKILTSKEGANFGQRKITVSTCGLADKIRAFARENLQVRLAVSLNSADDNVRARLMPVNRKHPLGALHEAIKYYIKTTGRRVTLEYVMLAGVNDRRSDLEALKRFCRGLNVNVNLIPFNRFGKTFKASSAATLDFFVKALLSEDINTIVRHSRGEEIEAACGQLAAKKK
ncbi:MAG: 23S rRNA (adenine(2503)-C(2))-methyltransferase RlmN [Candidatus Saganbacteria bacterium]|nr:23S rRNA (adenine(2503)-C(2))-methyltransferase RlmN [Candidatus Saganbacteria bacterium]